MWNVLIVGLFKKKIGRKRKILLQYLGKEGEEGRKIGEIAGNIQRKAS